MVETPRGRAVGPGADGDTQGGRERRWFPDSRSSSNEAGQWNLPA